MTADDTTKTTAQPLAVRATAKKTAVKKPAAKKAGCEETGR